MATHFITINNNLGENILYNEIDNSIYWIDINDKRMYIYNLETTQILKYKFPKKPCSYCFTSNNDVLLIAFEDGFYLFNKLTQNREPIESNYRQIEMCRLNDGKADPYGNFICGGFSELHPDKIPQELWLVSNDKKRVCNLSNSPKHTIWNATCFSTNKKYMYCTDSPKKELWRYNYDNIKYQQTFGTAEPELASNSKGLALHDIHNKYMEDKKVIYSLGDKDMVFDGACVDRDDYIWIAMYNGSCVYRISPDGVLDTVVDVPGDKYVTSVCIGGKDMDTLFIVTGHFGESNDIIKGFIYSYKLDKPLGVIENRFILQ